tara:strand:+ start:4577 stop:5044 length:468 start_codon:yes stop_codon:yes gene_type:complete
MQIALSYSTLASGVIIFLLVVWVLILELRLRRLTKGSNKSNMEAHLAAIARDYQDLNGFKTDVYGRITQIDNRLKGSVRGIGTVHFHPFAGSGSSKPSFATALVSEDGDGMVISTLHAHNSVSIFNKAVKNFTCEKELTAEETVALEKAKDSLHT